MALSMGGASGVAGGPLPPVPYALPSGCPQVVVIKKLHVPSRPFPSIIAA